MPPEVVVTGEELRLRFTQATPTATQVTRMHELSKGAEELGELIAESTPHCREQALAFTNLEQALFWALAAITRRE